MEMSFCVLLCVRILLQQKNLAFNFTFFSTLASLFEKKYFSIGRDLFSSLWNFFLQVQSTLQIPKFFHRDCIFHRSWIWRNLMPTYLFSLISRFSQLLVFPVPIDVVVKDDAHLRSVTTSIRGRISSRPMFVLPIFLFSISTSFLFEKPTF